MSSDFKTCICSMLAVAAMAISAISCAPTKYVPEGEYLLRSVVVKSDTAAFDPSQLQQYVRQKGNSRWFSLFKIPLGAYSLSGRDTTKWINRTLRNIGEPPVVYQPQVAEATKADLLMAMQNMGYMAAKVDHQVILKGRKATEVYTLSPGHPYMVDQIAYDIADDSIKAWLSTDSTVLVMKEGGPFSVNDLVKERNRIVAFLQDRGYYKFHKEYIRYEADTMRNSHGVLLTMHIAKFRQASEEQETLHPRYVVGDVEFASIDSGTMHLKPKVLEYASAIRKGQPFAASDVKRTYNNFSRLGAVSYSNVRMVETTTDTLQCLIQYGLNKPSTLSFQPEGTNTAGDLGAAASLTYENRNLFHGSEAFSLQWRGAYEAITGLEGYQNENYVEYGVVSKLSFPRLVVPLVSNEVRRKFNAVSELSLSYNLQNRPEFHRRVLSGGWRYRWTNLKGDRTYKIDAIDLNFIHMPWISSTFKHDYLDSVSNRNAILRYNYEDLLIMRTGFGLTYNTGTYAFKANVEAAGNLASLVANALDLDKNANGQRVVFNIAYAQYVKGDVDLTRMIAFDEHNSLVLHAGLGIAYPYGNSKVLPFEKRYFSGGANSVRGWNVRGLGPGKFRGYKGDIDFINQTGDMKLDLNMEYRTRLFWKFSGAFFIDAGNIWTLRNYAEQPGGQFLLDEFYKQIAVAYGLGVRLNFDYFILRFDMGMKAIDPAYESGREHYPVAHPDMGRDFSFHFAVGMPF